MHDKRLNALPQMGKDLFAGKFQESMESEAKRLKATDEMNLRKPQASTPQAKKVRVIGHHFGDKG